MRPEFAFDEPDLVETSLPKFGCVRPVAGFLPFREVAGLRAVLAVFFPTPLPLVDGGFRGEVDSRSELPLSECLRPG